MPFERELSVVAVRGRDGEFRTWPLTENWHVDGVLSASLAPAPVDDGARGEARSRYARALAEALDYVGVFALELFCRDGALLANEMAPRVHNSGHWTIEGSETSQFQNHLRAVLGLPLGDTRMRRPGLHAQLDRRDARRASRCCANPAATGTTTASRRARAARSATRRCARDSRKRLAHDAAARRRSARPRGAGRAGDRRAARLSRAARLASKANGRYPGRSVDADARRLTSGSKRRSPS